MQLQRQDTLFSVLLQIVKGQMILKVLICTSGPTENGYNAC